MEREKSSRKRTSGIRSRVTRANDDDDTKSSASQIRPFGALQIDESADRSLVRIIEFCSDTLIDRFLDFEGSSASLLVRSFEGNEMPGPVIAAFSMEQSVPFPLQVSGTATDEFQLFFYSDTEFFHILKNGDSQLLCAAHLPGERHKNNLQSFLEKISGKDCFPLPMMAACVKMTLMGNMNLRAFLELRAPTMTSGSLASNWIPSYVNAATGHHMDTTVQQTSILRGAATVNSSSTIASSIATIASPLQTSRARKLVDEFSLLFHQGSPVAVLTQSLDRIRVAVRSTEIPLRCGPQLDSFLSTVPPLLEMMWSTTTRSTETMIRDDVAGVISDIVDSLLQSQTAFLFTNFVNDTLQILLAMLVDPVAVETWSTQARQSIVAVFSLINSTQCVKYFRSLSWSTPDDFLTLASSLTKCCLSALKQQKSLVPSSDLNSALISSRLKEAVSWETRNFLMFHPSGVNMTGAGEQRRSWAVNPSLEGLLLALPVCLDLIMATIDSTITALLYSPSSPDHARMAALILDLTEAVSLYLNVFLSMPVEKIPSLLTFCTPSLCSYFRRVVSWCEFSGVSPIPGRALGQSVFFIALIRIARRLRPEHLSYIQHEWLSKLSIACGPLGSRHFASSLHELFQFFDACHPSWVLKDAESFHGCFVAIFEDISSVCSRLVSSAPSPSLLLSCWGACLNTTNAFVKVANDPLILEPRMALVRQLVVSGALSVGERFQGPSRHFDGSLAVFMRQNVGWDDLISYRQSRLPSALERRTSYEVRVTIETELMSHELFCVILSYLIPAVENEKIYRRWNTFSAQLFDIAQFLSDLSAPHGLLTFFVQAAVAVSKKLRGTDVVSLVAVSSRYTEETFQRICVETAWNLTGSITPEVLTSQTDVLPPEPQARQGKTLDSLPHFIVTKRKEAPNLLHRLATSYKQSSKTLE